MTTRGGKFISLRQLREEVGNDAARFYYVSRSNDQHLDFDLDVAKSESNDNPVYYIQYAHARIASVFRQLGERSLVWDADNGYASLALLAEQQEKMLMSTLSRYPEVVDLAAANRAPQHLVHYLRDLANDFHTYYNAHVFIVDDDGLRESLLQTASPFWVFRPRSRCNGATKKAPLKAAKKETGVSGLAVDDVRTFAGLGGRVRRIRQRPAARGARPDERAATGEPAKHP
jgi:hypothetical protein